MVGRRGSVVSRIIECCEAGRMYICSYFIGMTTVLIYTEYILLFRIVVYNYWYIYSPQLLPYWIILWRMIRIIIMSNIILNVINYPHPLPAKAPPSTPPLLLRIPPPQFEGGYNLVLIYWENYNKVQYKSVRILTPGQGGIISIPPYFRPLFRATALN